MLALVLAVTLAHARVEVHAHRGGLAAFPENTLAAFRHSLDLGVEYLELDVRLTKDDQLVLHHDPALSAERCLSADGAPIRKGIKIRDLTYAELARFDCGSIRHPEFPSQRPSPGAHIPLLSEVYSLIRESGNERVGVHLEIKAHPGGRLESPTAFARKLMAEIRDSGFLDRTIVQSFDPRYTSEAKRAAAELVRKFEPKIISPPHQWLRRSTGRLLFRALKRLGFTVVPWTVNAPADWGYLIDLGVDGIVTDDPEGLIQFMQADVARM